MRAIRKAFPDPRFLHLHTDPVANGSVMSLNDGAYALYVDSIEFLDDRAVVEPQFAWHDQNVDILNFLDEVPSHLQLRIRGEHIIGDPRHYLGIICRWLAIRDDDEAIGGMIPSRAFAVCLFGPINALFGNDPEFSARPVPPAQS